MDRIDNSAAEAEVPEEVVRTVERTFSIAAHNGSIRDAALLGAASHVYPWVPAFAAEVDLLVLVDEYSPQCGEALLQTVTDWKHVMQQWKVLAEFRIVRGPYKNVHRTQRSLLIHAAVFTVDDYSDQAAPLLRWSWRKYKCFVRPGRLGTLAPARPGAEELLSGVLGIDERLNFLKQGRAPLSELSIPTWSWRNWEIVAGEELYTEYCLAAIADTARNHGRVLCLAQADSLPNHEYFPFYADRVFSSRAFNDGIQIKNIVRRQGYRGLAKRARECAITYLEELRFSLLNGAS